LDCHLDMYLLLRPLLVLDYRVLRLVLDCHLDMYLLLRPPLVLDYRVLRLVLDCHLDTHLLLRPPLVLDCHLGMYLLMYLAMRLPLPRQNLNVANAKTLLGL